MVFTIAEVNTWFQTIDGLPPTTASIPSSIAMAYVDDSNAVPPTATPVQIQANLKNFPFNTSGTGNVETTTFYRTTVAQFVLREFQAAWGVVPTTTGAGSQFDNWVARILSDPTVESGTNPATSMSVALAGTTQFALEYGIGGPGHAGDIATAGFINKLWANLGLPGTPGAGLLGNVGVTPVWEVLQSVVTSPFVISNMYSAVTNFQDLLVSGGNIPGSLFTQPGTPNANLTLTIGVDSPTEGFASGHGATATAAGSIFTATPASNPPLGITNTLQTGDDLEATGFAAGATTLNYTAVFSFINPEFATAVTMNGVNAAVITNQSFGVAGFVGDITGLTSATLAAGSFGAVELGLAGIGLNTALADVTINSSQDFSAWMTPAAFAAGPAVTIHLGGVDTDVTLNNSAGGGAGYASMAIDSIGGSANDLILNTNADTTATITVTATSTQALTLGDAAGDGSALNIAFLHTFDGSAATVVENVFFNGFGAVAVTGGSADNTFTFTTGAGDFGNFSGSGSTVNGGVGGTNTLVIQADTGAIIAAGDNAGITNIATVVHDTVAGGFGVITADLLGLNPTTVFDLNGTYDAAGVTVSNIANDQTVEFTGTSDSFTPGAFVALAAPTPLGLDAQINLQISQIPGEAPTDLGRLVVGPGLDSLNVHGLDGGGTITDVTLVADNVNIDGDSFVTFGSAAGAYAFTDAGLGGVIDAHTDMGGVETWLASGPTATGNAAQTFIGGPGGATVNLTAFGGAVVDFTIAGPDTVAFRNANASSTATPTDPTHQYNQVLGFTDANGTVNINNSTLFGTGGTELFTTNAPATVVADGDATNTFHFTTDVIGADALTEAFNYVKIDTAITAPAASTVQAAFAEAMGPVGDILVSGAHARLLSFYDTTTHEAVLVAANSGAVLITGADHVNVVGLIHMTAADYATFTPHFTAAA